MTVVLRSIVGTAVFVVSLLAAGSVLGQGNDRVFPIEGRTLTGTIKSISRTGLKIETGGREVEVPVTEIKSVNFADEPRDVTTARRALAEGRLNNALQAVESLDASRLQPPGLAADVRFLVAFCSARLALSGERGTLDQASEAVAAFLASDPESMHYYSALGLSGEVAVARGAYPDAEKSFAGLVESPWAETQQQGRLKLARVLELQDRYEEAEASYRQVGAVESATAASRQAKLSARVGMARCAASRGEAGQAIEQLQQMIVEESSTNTELFAQIYNALGLAQLRAGRTKEAINAFLHTDLLYYQSSDYHAEALYYLGDLFAEIGRVPESSEARERLKSRYGSSPWAARRPAP